MATGSIGSNSVSNYANTSTGFANKFSASVYDGGFVGLGLGGGGLVNRYAESTNGMLVEVGVGYILDENGNFITSE